MPSPARHGAKGHTFAVFFGEGLKAGDIDGHSEVSVAYCQRRHGVDGGYDRVVALQQSHSVDGCIGLPIARNEHCSHSCKSH